jgi:NitT/TauT family transport system substrate-binding protein
MSALRKIVLLIFMTLLIAACQPIATMQPPAQMADSQAAPAPAAPASMPDLGTLQVAYVPVIGFAPFFVAADKGYFAEQGLTVELLAVRNVDEMLAPLSTGKVDMTMMSVTTGFLNAMNLKMDFRIVSGVGDPTAPANDATFLVVSKALADSGEVATVSDLKGRKIAINLRGSGLEYLLYKGLDQAGLTLNDVELVTIPGREMLIALQNGAVDGAVAGGLNIEQMIGQGVATPLLATADVVANGDAGGLVFGQRLLDPANREVGIRILTAYLKAARYLNDGGWADPEVTASIQTYTGMEPALIAQTPVSVYAADGTVDEVGTLDMQAFQLSQGYVEFTETIPLAQMVDLSMLSEALARLDQE